MQLAILQTNPISGNFIVNVNDLINKAKQAKFEGANICFAPLFSISGVNCGDLKNTDIFVKKFQLALEKLTYQLKDGPILILGGINGEILKIENGKCLKCGDIEIIHNKKIYLTTQLSEIDIEKECDLVCYILALPFGISNWDYVRKICINTSKELSCEVCFINIVGGNDNLVYFGLSSVFSSSGDLKARALAFREDILLFALGSNNSKIENIPEKFESIFLALVTGLRDFCKKCGISGAVIGLSGGMDSALVCALAYEALGKDNILCVLMPSPYTSVDSLVDARKLAENLDVKLEEIPIKPLMEGFNSSLSKVLNDYPSYSGDVTLENIQARIRGNLLASISNRSRRIILNTGNKSEIALGYCTLYGDGVGAISVIGDLLKTEVYKVASWYNDYRKKEIIPKNVFDKEPSAELRLNQKDSDSLPVYAELDPLIEKFLNGAEITEDIARKIVAAEFKRRQLPMALTVSSRPFSMFNMLIAGKIFNL